MRRLAHTRLAALRDAPILFGAGAVALLVDVLLLALWIGLLGWLNWFGAVSVPMSFSVPAVLGRPTGAGSIGVLLALVLLAAGATLAGAAIRAAGRRTSGTRNPRILFAATALSAAVLIGGGIIPLSLPGDVELVQYAESRATSGSGAELLVLIDLGYPSAVAAARARLADPEPGIRFLYGAGLEVAGYGDPASRHAMSEAIARLRELARSNPALSAKTRASASVSRPAWTCSDGSA
jgi:hypothetical protein